MELTKQINNKVDILFEKFLEDKEVFDEKSFFEKLISFGANNNFHLNSRHIGFLCLLSASIEVISFFFLVYKIKSVNKNSSIPPVDTEQVRRVIIIFAIFNIVLAVTTLGYLFMKIVSDQKSSKEIMMDVKKKCLLKSLSHYENSVANNFKTTSERGEEYIANNPNTDNFVIESLLTHFQYLIRKTDKKKDSIDACIPLITLLFILVCVFVIGIPSIPRLKELSSWYGFPTLSAFVTSIFKPTLVLASNNLSMKYSKCLLKMEDLKYRKSVSQVKIDETLRLLS
jgi:ABC-type multidrug transport system fused ATPase/permease subunit